MHYHWVHFGREGCLIQIYLFARLKKESLLAAFDRRITVVKMHCEIRRLNKDKRKHINPNQEKPRKSSPTSSKKPLSHTNTSFPPLLNSILILPPIISLRFPPLSFLKHSPEFQTLIRPSRDDTCSIRTEGGM